VAGATIQAARLGVYPAAGWPASPAQIELWITGRIDDVINVSGHRLSTAEIESALLAHPAVAEAAVVAVSDELTGQSVVAYVTLCVGVSAEPALNDALRQHVAERIGKLARPKRIIWPDMPKIRSGKITGHEASPYRPSGQERS
jgi:acyl-coenzyme A synthetase/AMP-(fatty) acid ligase